MSALTEMNSKKKEMNSIAAMSPGGNWARHSITRRATGPTDIAIAIKFAGICHSDIHQVFEEWGPASFPMVPGHEVGGVVTEVGSEVTDIAVGDHVGVGCLVDSCRDCGSCKNNLEQYCDNGGVFTYNSTYKYKVESGAKTYGGYSKNMTVERRFVVKIPKNLDLAAATPLLCAGITMYSPMVHYGLTPDMKFGVVGMGGLGHMGLKLGKAMGSHTTCISRGKGKMADALSYADAFVDSKDEAEMAAAKGTFDFIISTVSAEYDINMYIALLKVNGKLIVVGAPPVPVSLQMFSIIPQRKTLAGSLIGGLKETQDMMDFCAEKNIVCEIEKIGADVVLSGEAFKRVVDSDVKYRFVIDVSTI